MLQENFGFFESIMVKMKQYFTQRHPRKKKKKKKKLLTRRKGLCAVSSHLLNLLYSLADLCFSQVGCQWKAYDVYFLKMHILLAQSSD